MSQLACGIGKPLTKEELKKQKRQCWRPGCKHKAFIRDWAGWSWCLKDFIRTTRQSDHPWTEIKWAKLF